MKKLFAISALLLISVTLFFAGCSKDEDPVLPTIAFNKTAGYTSANATANLGDTIFMGVIATYNGTNNLVKFQLFANGISKFDTTINTTVFAYNISTVKGVNDKDVWKFVTTDIAGNVKSDSIIITGSFGEINSYANVKFGAQSNATVESFASYSNAQVTMYFQAAAFEHQSDIDMFCFYENNPPSYVNLMTLAAPGSNISGIFTGATAPNLYTTKNITFFVKTTLTVADFDAVHNDAVILDSYNPASQFKKAKLLTVNDIYAFKLQSGKYGLLKVTAVEGNETGTLQIAVKIQK